ncbi:MAG: succinylglutamate desuccinylase/aspartoacylase family protein [Verrucomicrobiales bacterium]|nr:succinylglutamate desuccinylase/aspartoacylase family protein [Verrucomicrobiales bacterium]
MIADEPFQVIEISGSSDGPNLLIVAGVHGDEYEGIAAIRELAAQLVSQREHLHGSVTLIPIVNEPAFAIPARCGDDGKDLARTCPGSTNGSPTEQIAHAISKRIRSADFFIDLHTGGMTMQVWPLIGYGLVANETVLETQRRMARAFGLPLVWGTSANLKGRTLSIAWEAGVPAIYGEYLGGGMCSGEGVKNYVEGCLRVMTEFGILTGHPKPDLLSEDHCIEDPRDQSGHMQICHPSPIAGYFESTVTLGEAIESGSLLGRVIPSDGGRTLDILANESGRVIVMRTCCSVQTDEPLAVILENAPAAAFKNNPLFS